ncbi:uncharacterized protein [Drosophila kikkawai]|uniref:Serine protease gd N-terminal domain-containing protein n=1 Tax=Drosophila kikkawai TaxID=30033 RepID=A0ABM4GKQ8_DROKI
MSIALLVCFLIGLNVALAVGKPENNCNYFRYSVTDHGRNHIGIFTADKANIKSFYWQAKFSVHGAHKDQVDQIDPFPSTRELADDIKAGRKAEVSVRFQNIENNELPKLIFFALNGKTLCRDTGYEAPVTTITVGRRMSFQPKETRTPRPLEIF